MTLGRDHLPLYRQVYQLLVRRLADNYWASSEAIPSESALASELSVSAGTVRKAIDQLVEEHLLVRKQGKGTFVTSYSNEEYLNRFFRLRASNGDTVIHVTKLLSSERRIPTAIDRSHLRMGKSEKIVVLTRLRYLNGTPTVVEVTVQSLALFPDIDKEEALPECLYSLYQKKYGITIASIREMLFAEGASKDFAKILNIKAGTPILIAKRSIIDVAGNVVALTNSYCNTDGFAYSSRFE